MTIRAAITGMGAVTGFGHGADRLWAALLGGDRAMRVHAELAALTRAPVALVGSLAPDEPSRAAKLALAAAEEALAGAGDGARGPRFGVACGTTLGDIGNWLPHLRAHAMVEPLDAVVKPLREPWTQAGPARAVAAAAGARGPLTVPSVACASGNVALGAALELIRDGRCDAVLAGGVDVLHDFVIGGFACLKALDNEPCRPFDRARRGLNLGEGACFLLLEAEAHARRRGARIRAFLDGFGVAADAVHMTGPDRQGRGAARAMQAALADGKLDAAAVECVSAHGTATVFNDAMEGRAMRLVFGERAAKVATHGIKGALGHTLGAAAALEALVAVRSLETGLIPATVGLAEIDEEIALDVVRGAPRAVRPRAVLSTSSGFGGTNAAVLLRRADAPGPA